MKAPAWCRASSEEREEEEDDDEEVGRGHPGRSKPPADTGVPADSPAQPSGAPTFPSAGHLAGFFINPRCSLPVLGQGGRLSASSSRAVPGLWGSWSCVSTAWTICACMAVPACSQGHATRSV